jgi:hypothetical protein
MLGLEGLDLPDSEENLGAEEALAAALRRAASFRAPIPRRPLIGEVSTAIAPYLHEDGSLRDRVRGMLDRLIDHGDLLEARKEDSGTRRIVLLRPPAFVEAGDTYFLIGVRPDGAPILTADLEGRLARRGAVRMLRPASDETSQELLDAGLQKVSVDQWVGAPAPLPAPEFLAIYRARLAESPAVGEIEGLEILDPDSDIRFYKGRFRHPSAKDTGFYVARRPQQFGPSRWCLAELHHGDCEKVIDLSAMAGLGRPTDEAWRLQAAIDSALSHPQVARVEGGPGERKISFFGPLPAWARKRVDLLGQQTDRSRGALFTYSATDADLTSLGDFLVESLWLRIEVQNR